MCLARWRVAGRIVAPTLILSLALASCGGGDDVTAANDTAVTPPSSSASISAPESSRSATESTAPKVNLQGNAATNPACKLLTLEEVQAAVHLDVIGMLGLPADTTNPDKHSESCTWFLDPKVVQSSLVVQYTTYAQPPSDLIAYYPQVIASGFGKAVPELGTVSKIDGHVLDTVYQRTEIHVTLVTHAEATAADQAAAIGLMRVVMRGIKQ